MRIPALVTALITAIALTAAAPQAHAELVVQPPLSVVSGLAGWVDGILERTEKYTSESDGEDQEPPAGYTECAPVKEVEHTHLCASYRQLTMNEAFARATYFVEKNATILRRDDPLYAALTQTTGGHDLHAADLLRFYSALQRRCDESGHDEALCPTDAETEIFETFILPTTLQDKDFVVIAFGILSDVDADTVVTHEIMHAQYFNEPAYRRIADDFWAQDVSDADKAKVRKILAPFYDSTNELLMRNEFQAYILMTHAERNMLSPLVPKYRSQFFEKMKEGGVVPLQLE